MVKKADSASKSKKLPKQETVAEQLAAMKAFIQLQQEQHDALVKQIQDKELAEAAAKLPPRPNLVVEDIINMTKEQMLIKLAEEIMLA